MRTILLTAGRTGSELICSSLMMAGYPIESEVLNVNSETCRKYFDDCPNVLNQPDEVKISLVEKVLEKNVLCKVNHYQINESIIQNLAGKYNIVRLVRDFLDIYISWQAGLVTKIWHSTFDTEPFVPKEKVHLDIDRALNDIDWFIHEDSVYRKYSSWDFSYNYVMDNWPRFTFELLTRVGLVPTIVNKAFVKNKFNPNEIFDNYKELKEAYVSTSRGSVFTKYYSV